MSKYINKFLNNPYQLFYFYILLNLIPSIFLICSEPYNFWGKIELLIFPIGLYFLCFSVAKNTGLIQLCLFPLLFLHAFQLVVFYLFREDVIAVDMFLNLVTTNPSEAGELINSILPSIIVICLMYIIVVIIAIREVCLKIYLPIRFRKRMLMAGSIIIFFSIGISFVSKNTNTGTYSFHRGVYPINVIYNLGFSINKFYKISKYTTTSKDFRFEAKKKIKTREREIYVLVIGETSRSDNWSLYGYERETTPTLKKESSLICFRDVLTQSNTTHKSVPIILSAASAENFNIIYKQKSIIEAFKEVGFTTVFLSNQAPNHSFTYYFSQQSDHAESFRSGYDRINNLDEILLPRLQYWINSTENNLFVVMHTYGSHFNYKERYSPNFAKYRPSNITEVRVKDKNMLVNAYDNSILYTDYFLSNVINILNKANACASMLYTSDHGEDLMDDARHRFLHSSPNPTYYQLRIPLFIWSSDIYSKEFPDKIENAIKNKNKPVATNIVFHTLLDMADIETKYRIDSLSLVNSHYNVTKRMYLDDHDKPIFFYNANLKAEDKYMIEKEHIYH